jgi:hypothetical protein
MTRYLAILPLLLATPAFAAPGVSAPCDKLPPPHAWQVPTVPMVVHIVANAEIGPRCHKLPSPYILYGCTYPATASTPAIILLNADLKGDERVCVLLYEEAHLPPNNWADPRVEATAPDDPKLTGAE